MIGYCGYSCHLCAARSDDPVVRQKLVDGWRRIFGHQQYTAENVRCDGCRSEGRTADSACAARPCAKEKNIDSCAHCEQFPCPKMRHLMGSRDGLLIFCRPSDTHVSEEDYNLCMRQFDSMPNLVRLLAAAGKLDSWVVAEAGADSTGAGRASAQNTHRNS
jgi:hypothetical protein